MEHRKIELQAPEDLNYLLDNVRRAAALRLDEAFPPMDGAQGEDELRTRIERLVNEYITKTFTFAAPNLSINGLDVDPKQYLSSKGSGKSKSGAAARVEETYEPFDTRKRARVEELTREEEDLLIEIATLKKSVPAAAAGAWAEGTRAAVTADEEALAAALREQLESREGEEDLTAQLRPLERQADVEKSYASAVQGLSRLKREMPAVVARMERARAAGEYVVTER